MSTEPKALDVERYDDEGKPHFCYETDDEEVELYFLWDAVRGDPIQVVDGGWGVIIDLIPTDDFSTGLMEMVDALARFKEWCETYVAQYKNKQEMEETSDDKPVANNGPTISGGTVRINWTDEAGNIVSSGEVVIGKSASVTIDDPHEAEQTESANEMLERLLTPQESPR